MSFLGLLSQPYVVSPMSQTLAMFLEVINGRSGIFFIDRANGRMMLIEIGIIGMPMVLVCAHGKRIEFPQINSYQSAVGFHGIVIRILFGSEIDMSLTRLPISASIFRVGVSRLFLEKIVSA